MSRSLPFRTPSNLSNHPNSSVQRRKAPEVPQTNLKSAGNKSFRYQAAVVWNSLPIAVRNSPPLSSIKIYHKTYLFWKHCSLVLYTLFKSLECLLFIFLLVVCWVFLFVFFFVLFFVVVVAFLGGGGGVCTLYVLGKCWYCFLYHCIGFCWLHFNTNLLNALFCFGTYVYYVFSSVKSFELADLWTLRYKSAMYYYYYHYYYYYWFIFLQRIT